MNPDRTPAPLTELSEDENLFLSTVRQFAQEQITPLVRRMDEEQHMDAGLVRNLFELGLMGVAIPEQYGGSGGTFFDSVLAVEVKPGSKVNTSASAYSFRTSTTSGPVAPLMMGRG